jgi:heptosyltransferase-2
MIAYLKNILLYCIVKGLQCFIKKEYNSSSILIVSATGLGDTIWATPAISALKESLPNSKIHLLTTGLGKETLLHNPHIESVIVITAQSFFALYKDLLSLKIGTVLIFHSSDRYLLPLVACIGANKIVGVRGEQKGLERLLTHKIEKGNVHEIDKRMLLVNQLGATLSPRPLEILVTQEEEKEALYFLKKQGWDGKSPLIGLQPGAKDAFKLWPSQYFIATAKKLQSYHPFFVITGSLYEARLVKQIASQIPNSLPLFGQISLRTLAGIIKNLSLYITNDTGPMHLAFSQNIPTIALFAPTSSSLCGPYLANNAFVIEKSRTCQPCLKKKCQSPFCMRQINVEDVYIQATKILGDL